MSFLEALGANNDLPASAPNYDSRPLQVRPELALGSMLAMAHAIAESCCLAAHSTLRQLYSPPSCCLLPGISRHQSLEKIAQGLSAQQLARVAATLLPHKG